MPRITRSARLATNGSTTADGTELLAPSTTTITTRSQSNMNNAEGDETGAPIVIRRSTRRAALDAKVRIAEESKREFERKRRNRSRRTTVNNNNNGDDDAIAQQRSPDNNSLDLKPAALPSGTKQLGGALFKSDETAALEEDGSQQLEEFTCAICLDKPDTLVDLATISGCSHKFCFDCIDKVSFCFQSLFTSYSLPCLVKANMILFISLLSQ